MGGLAKECGENMFGNSRTDLARKGMLPIDWGRAGRLTELGPVGGRRAVDCSGAAGEGCAASGISSGSWTMSSFMKLCYIEQDTSRSG